MFPVCVCIQCDVEYVTVINDITVSLLDTMWTTIAVGTWRELPDGRSGKRKREESWYGQLNHSVTRSYQPTRRVNRRWRRVWGENTFEVALRWSLWGTKLLARVGKKVVRWASTDEITRPNPPERVVLVFPESWPECRSGFSLFSKQRSNVIIKSLKIHYVSIIWMELRPSQSFYSWLYCQSKIINFVVMELSGTLQFGTLWIIMNLLSLFPRNLE